MLVDKSARIWAMRRDDVMAAETVRLREGREEQSLLMAGERLEGSDFARVVDGVAVIPMRGPLMRAMSFWFWSYEEIARDITLAQDSRAVSSILLDIDSPGGLVAGCGDLAEFIATSGPKPIEAFVGGLCASAAYWIASSTSRITLGSGATVGSIGAVIEYVDVEPMFEAMGARIVRVVSDQSPNKRLDPESAEGQQEMLDLVNHSAGEFIAGVARGRGVDEATVLDRFGQGLVFNSSAAIERGMADARGRLEPLIAELAGRDVINAVPAAAAEETPMDWETLTLAQLREHRADLVTQIEQAAVTTSETANKAQIDEAVAAERTRIAEIDEIAVTGFEDLVATAKRDGWAADKLALEMVKADKAAGTSHLATRRADDQAAAVEPLPQRQTVSTEPSATDADAGDDVALRTQWDADPKLRAEFGGDFDSFKAFRKAEASGRARVRAA